MENYMSNYIFDNLNSYQEQPKKKYTKKKYNKNQYKKDNKIELTQEEKNKILKYQSNLNYIFPLFEN
jgi:hypothetical protein